MATETDFLKLVKPENGEYQDTWDSVANPNYDKIDDFADGVNTELSDARGDESTLAERLDVSLNPDGTLLPTDEVVQARNSFLYGDETTLPEDFELGDRITQSDTEVYKTREGQASVRDVLAFRELMPSLVLKGASNANGYPTWLGFTGANAQIDGSTTNLWFMIEGYLQRIRTLEQVTISGSAGTYYLYATFNEDGEIIVDGDSSTPPPASPTGTTGSDGSKIRIFEDLTVDFTTYDVQVGDALDILGNGLNAGRYLIRTVAPSANNNRLQIQGVFKSSVSSLDYVIKDVIKPTLSFTDTKTPTTGRLYIGEADFDGASITAVRALHFKDTFVGEWRAVDVSSTPTFEEFFNHNLFSDQLDISIQVSQADDGSQPVEELSMAKTKNNLVFALNHSADVFDPDVTDATFTEGSFAPTLTGSVDPSNSAVVQWTAQTISIKNPINNLFYTDYSGTEKDTGFIRVIARKRT